MNEATSNQIAFITDLANRILAVDVERLPTKAKAPAPARFTFNPQQNARDAQKIAAEALTKIEAGEVTKIGASNWIETLKVQARRARA